MEPELPTPRLTPERSPLSEMGNESLPDTNTEKKPEQSAERFEQRSEASASAADAATIALPTVAPTPVIDSASAGGDDRADDDTPVNAADEDLIEKEWVDKAKQIINKTKDDPYLREQEISRLQVEYLRKRYGKELGTSN